MVYFEMKRIKTLLTSVMMLAALTAAGQNVRLEVTGIDNAALKAAIETSTSRLLSEINAANQVGRSIDFTGILRSGGEITSLAMLWNNCHFKVTDTEIVEKCLETGSGWQVRNIPLIMTPAAGSFYEGDDYQEAVINYSRTGQIESFYLSIDQTKYLQVLRGNQDLTDLRRRQLILDYVERFRTAYNQKDIRFLDQIFSDDALIITGKVIRATSKDTNIKVPDKITYKKQDKQEYLTNLKGVFARNAYIRVTFDEVEVKFHPTNINIYGVTLHQGYSASGGYHDDGYVFLLWDFTNEDEPKIHVRTWQPDRYDTNGRNVTKDEVFSCNDFDI